MEEHIWTTIAQLDTPGFFITAEIQRKGEEIPGELEIFIFQKLQQIRAGISARRFVFQQEGWRMYLTFFPTDEVVSEKYALKNKVMARDYR